jgi:hypothetical protein
MIICYTHVISRHLELKFLNLMHIDRFTQIIEKKNHFIYNPLLQNLKTLEFSYDLFFHKIYLMNM